MNNLTSFHLDNKCVLSPWFPHHQNPIFKVINAIRELIAAGNKTDDGQNEAKQPLCLVRK